MKFIFPLLCFLTLTLHAQQDTTKKERRVRFGLYSSLSYQFTVNPNGAHTNLGNVAFKGYLQPGIGLGVRYQQDSSEFALITASAAFLAYTIGTKNIIYDNGNSYEIVNRYDFNISNFALEGSYHKRLGKLSANTTLAWECGAGLHVLYWAGATYSGDTAVGPYTITRQLESRRDYYVMPSAQLGLDMTIKSPSHRTEYIIGLRSQIYLSQFAEVRYDIQYTSPNTTLNYHIRYSPVILTPKAYVMVVF